MSFANVESKTTFRGFSQRDERIILKAMKTAYEGSSTAKTMFDNYIANQGNKINIKFEKGEFAASLGTGRLFLDLSFLKDNTYISPTGKAVEDTALSAIIHELGHALTSRTDKTTKTDYKGPNVRFVNKIYAELGIPEQLSYIAYDDDGSLHKLNFEYTNGQKIDRAVSGNSDWNSSAAGNSRDLLIGGAAANELKTGAGNDFLVGAGGNDTLNGGIGKDTAVYTGNRTDYDILKNANNTWTVDHLRGAANEGKDTLRNIEKVQFARGKTFDLNLFNDGNRGELIGGASANELESHTGNDFLFGTSDEDNLNSGSGVQSVEIYAL